MGEPFTCAGPGNPEDWIRNAEEAPQKNYFGSNPGGVNSLNCCLPDSAENQHRTRRNEARAKKEIKDKEEMRDKKNKG